jgi:hypothetical protein
MNRLLASLVVFAVGAGVTAGAQSLAEVARKEEERRQAIGKAARVYTNKDLQPVRPGEPVTAAPADPATPADKSERTAGKDGGSGATAAEAQPSGALATPKQYTEAQWRTRMADARDDLERTRMIAEALQSRVNALWADFTARDDPAQRAALEIERQRTIAELARVKNDIETKAQAIVDLEDEARRARVPPGWLR